MRLGSPAACDLREQPLTGFEPKHTDAAAPRRRANHGTPRLGYGVEAGPNLLATLLPVGVGVALDVEAHWTAVSFVVIDDEGVRGFVSDQQGELARELHWDDEICHQGAEQAKHESDFAEASHYRNLLFGMTCWGPPMSSARA